MVSIRFGKKKRMEASLILDEPEIKIVSVTLADEPIYMAVGKGTRTARAARGKIEVPLRLEGAYESEYEYEWTTYVNPNKMPGFVPEEQARQLMMGTITLVSGEVTTNTNVENLPSEDVEIEIAPDVFLKWSNLKSKLEVKKGK